MTAPAGFTTVAASRLQDATGTLITNATAYFSPVDNNGKPISFRAGGIGGQVGTERVSVPVNEGSLTLVLADTTLTHPVNVGYALEVVSNVTGKVLLGPGYGCLQPSGEVWSVDNDYTPRFPAQITLQPGTQGIQGIQGIQGLQGLQGQAGTSITFRGAWNASTAYAIGDVVSYLGSSYIRLLAGTTSGAPASDTTDWSLIAAAGADGDGGSGGGGVTGTPVYPNTAAGVAAGTGATPGVSFLIPSAFPDGLYDVYLNNAGTAVFQTTIPNTMVRSDGSSTLTIADDAGWAFTVSNSAGRNPVDAPMIDTLVTEVAALQSQTGTQALAQASTTSTGIPLAVQDDSGFVATVLLVDATSPVFDGTYGLADLIAAINTKCLTFSATLRGNTVRPTQETLRYAYNLVIQYGQSLSTGYQTQIAYSVAAYLSNLTLGSQVRTQYGNAGTPYTDSNFHPGVEAVDSSIGQGETGTVAAINLVKALVNVMKGTSDDTDHKLVAMNLGVPGQTIAQLSPASTGDDGSGFNDYNRLIVGTTAAKAAAGSSTIGVLATIYQQGEYDELPGQGSPPAGDTATYLAASLALRAAIEAQYQTVFGQNPATNQPGWYTYQTKPGTTASSAADNAGDAVDFAISMAQLRAAIEQPNTFMWGGHYYIPDFGLHKTANGYRWMGNMAGKCIFRTAILREGWQPLRPLGYRFVGQNVILGGFHVPCPPLTVQTAYNMSTAVNWADLGFKVTDVYGVLAITVAIVSDTVIQITADREIDQASCWVTYGAQLPHQRVGNVADSDGSVFMDLYVHPDNDPRVSGQPSFDIAALSGKPYPANNFCVHNRYQPAAYTI